MSQSNQTRGPGFNGVQVIEVHVNVDQEVIQITDDKLRLILKDHLDTISQSSGWVSPFSILVSIGATFCTAKFDTFIGLGPEFWRSFFSLIAIAALVWLIMVLRKERKVLTLDEFINKVKNKS